MIDLIPLNRATRSRSQNAIDWPVIVPLLSQGPLHLHCHVPRRSVAVAEDRAVVNVVAVIGIISVGGIPPAAVPIPVTAPVKYQAEIVAPPPIAFVTLPPIPAPRVTKRQFISGAFEMAPRRFAHLHIVVSDNVRLFGFFGANNLGVLLVPTRRDIRMRLLGRTGGQLLVAARLGANMPATRLRASTLGASPRCARLGRLRCLASGLRLFLLLLFGLIVGLRSLHRCQTNQQYRH